METIIKRKIDKILSNAEYPSVGLSRILVELFNSEKQEWNDRAYQRGYKNGARAIKGCQNRGRKELKNK
jgi:hypothetical protein